MLPPGAAECRKSANQSFTRWFWKACGRLYMWLTETE
jgi:hypothetical protein